MNISSRRCPIREGIHASSAVGLERSVDAAAVTKGDQLMRRLGSATHPCCRGLRTDVDSICGKITSISRRSALGRRSTPASAKRSARSLASERHTNRNDDGGVCALRVFGNRRQAKAWSPTPLAILWRPSVDQFPWHLFQDPFKDRL